MVSKIIFNGREFTNSTEFLATYKDTIKRVAMELHLKTINEKLSPFYQELQDTSGSIEVEVIDEEQIRTRLIDVPVDIRDRILAVLK